MIPAVPTSRTVLVLATLVVLLAVISSWMPLVEAIPVTSTDRLYDDSRRSFCTHFLAEEIQRVCNGRTLSLSDAFPNSFGNRNKRDDTNQSSRITHDCCIQSCSHIQLKQYCKTDST
ncbi:hypothetical protein KR009_003643 [Drosophila setifemur]|nr:hypothetical protein KR009_003643 [Drosophila setifemur]